MKPYYPLDFVEDLNGKRNSWEAVVLLPFIDINKLKDAVTEVENNTTVMDALSVADKQRNVFGEVFSYLPQEKRNQSSAVTSLTEPSPAAAVAYTIAKSKPDISPGLSFSAKMKNGTIIPYDGFPSLRSLPIKYVFIRLLHQKAMIGMKYKTLILGVSEQSLGNDENALKQILGGHVFVNYPMRHEAKVIGVSTNSAEFFLDETSTNQSSDADDAVVITEKYRNEEEAEEWQLRATKCNELFMAGHRGAVASGSGGLAIGTVDTMLTVLPVWKSVICGSRGERARQYGPNSVEYPLQLVQLQGPSSRRQRADAGARRYAARNQSQSQSQSLPQTGKAATANAGGTRPFSSFSATSTTTSTRGTGMSMSAARLGARQLSFFLRKIR